MKPFRKALLLTSLGFMLASASTATQADSKPQDVQKDGPFKHKKLSTIDTIPFKPMDKKALSNAVIEGGLEAPAAGQSQEPRIVSEDQQGADPLAFQNKQQRDGSAAPSFPVTFNYRDPRSVPGVTFTDGHSLQLPSNRVYQTSHYNVISR